MAQLKDLLVLGDSRFIGASSFTDITVSNLITTKDLAVTGIVKSGTWNGSVITVPYGGTGKSSFDSGEVLVGNGTGALTTKPIDSTVTSGSTNPISSGAVYTKLAGYAKIQSPNDMIHSSNEYTFASDGFTGAIWINYRTVGGTNGNITTYNFGNGKGGTTGVTLVAATFSGALSGNASTATKLKTARSLKVSLSSTAAQSFDGSADATSIGVAGTLGTGNGGTGNTSFTANTLIYASSATKLSSATKATISGSVLTLTDSSTGGVQYVAKNSNGTVSLFASTNRGVYDDTNSKWIIYTSTAGSNTYVTNWKSKGGTANPVYFNSSGEPVACSALVNLNGTDLLSKATFYAPTSAGTSGYFLRSNGSSKAPTWTNTAEVEMTFTKGLTINGNNTGSGTDSIDFGYGLKIRRSSADTEALKVTIDNSVARFFYTNDERASSFRFVMHNADTESPVTAGSPVPNTSVVTFAGDVNGSTVTATYFVGNGASLTNLNANNIKSGTLPVVRGGTGIASMTSNAVLIGGSTVGQVAAKSGAFYSTGANVKPVFGTLPIAQGGTGLTSSPSLLVNLGSTSAASVLTASPRPGITGTLGTANGGTGRAGGWTANRVVYTESTTKLGYTGHYVNASQMSINATTAPATGINLHVEGNANVDGDLSLDSSVKFVYNSTDKCIDVIFM